MVHDIYNEMLDNFSCSLKQASQDDNEKAPENYMTLCDACVVNFDKFKNDFVKDMSLMTAPRSCDVLFRNAENEYFLIEFKNGIIDALKNYEIKMKILESLLMLSERFIQTGEFMRNNLIFILVYNADVQHGQKQFEDTGLDELKKNLFELAGESLIRFGLYRFKKLYFKEVYTYSKTEFETEFVDKHCCA